MYLGCESFCSKMRRFNPNMFGYKFDPIFLKYHQPDHIKQSL